MSRDRDERAALDQMAEHAERPKRRVAPPPVRNKVSRLRLALRKIVSLFRKLKP